MRMKMFAAEIKILDFLNKTLDTRESASRLFSQIKSSHCNCSKLEIDFSGVEFMSRSFADQFHKERILFQRDNNCNISFKNADYQIIDILNAVANTQTDRKPFITNYQLYTFNDLKKMDNYIFAW
jgi:hypothetical protein